MSFNRKKPIFVEPGIREFKQESFWHHALMILCKVFNMFIYFLGILVVAEFCYLVWFGGSIHINIDMP